MSPSFIHKYNVPGPRYTSYPTVPYWDNDFSPAQYIDSVRDAFRLSDEGISIYIHLPFCESMCTFCGCHKRITKNHQVEAPYINALITEWKLYCSLFESKPVIRELHLGGGTPTFFAVKNLEDLINGIFSCAQRAENFEMGFEGHPNNTTRPHLQTLYELGFRRVSFGVQDYSDRVQRAINRIQPFENVSKVTAWAREIGYTSISHDLVFGLPFQTTSDVVDTVTKTVSLLPDRISFYSYAHVPWIPGNGQRGFSDADIPKDEDKRRLYETGRAIFETHGYREIGMDHFALTGDPLLEAAENQSIHRNFMGYTPNRTRLLIGLGVSSIGDSWTGFGQNAKSLEDYYQMLEWGQLPLSKGHMLTKEDLIVRQHILDLMCRMQTHWTDDAFYFTEVPEILASLSEMLADGLVAATPGGLIVTPEGKPFLRNICMAFDLRLRRKRPDTPLFSMTV
ncbi:oxygen-independent coproporphyrinogen III oxidase [Flavobacterium magnum]|uniref:Coproporphyrinogen-III oxidase n=1 Tax=Flavobacterium magnum TaxID=2162713 RepID=A0A2S0RIH3_9FLAO|nr:oxygen-independent coproporphyrinogen III oxidase [Flavobacterium magnum]AWA30921.1 oxygen-independent coproporphyrinogen III oxidase [Flavobacterium magnum]